MPIGPTRCHPDEHYWTEITDRTNTSPHNKRTFRCNLCGVVTHGGATEQQMPSRITLVGELNPSAGERLCCDILGMWRKEYLATFDRVNLCDGRWSVVAARTRAKELCKPGAKLVLLGAKVCQGFGLPYSPFSTFGVGISNPNVEDASTVLILPHPSGRCQAWNDPNTIPRARARR